MDSQFKKQVALLLRILPEIANLVAWLMKNLQLVETVHSRLRTEDKLLLKSFAEGNPQWNDKNWSVYPGIKWKLVNINKLKQADRKKFMLQLKLLEDVLND